MIESKIGHLKSDHRLSRCFLRSLAGDALNAVLAAAGSNLRKLLRRLFFVPAFLQWLIELSRQHHHPQPIPIPNPA